MRVAARHLPWIALIAVTLIYVFVAANHSRWKSNGVIRWDVYGYTMYLSGTFIHRDLKTLSEFNKIDVIYAPCADFKGYARHALANGNFVLKYTMGNAIMMSPFYLLAHFHTKNFSAHIPDGHTLPYHLAVSISSIFYTVLGLAFLILYLQKRYSQVAITITVISLAIGTNLLFYASIETGMTHVVTFFLFSFFLWAFDAWSVNHKWIYAVFLGVCVGLILLVRPTDVVVVAFFLPLYLHHVIEIKNNSTKIFFQTAIAFCISMLVVSPQLLYWKITTGQWVFNSYVGEHFDFLHPHIIDGLLSYKKGWLIYTPIVFFSFIGVASLALKRKAEGIGLIIFLIVNCFVVFSWWSWWYGGSFGARSMIQSYALLSIGFAAGFETIISWLRVKRSFRILSITALAVCVSFVGLNCFQIFQYQRLVLHWENMNKKAYWYTFGKVKITSDEFHMLYE